LPTIKVPDTSRVSEEDDASGGPPQAFKVVEYEASAAQAATWNRLNDKEKLTLVLKADREHRDVRDYL
jgi:hypothetical protein